MPSPAFPPNDKRPAVPSGSTTQVQMYAGQPSNHQAVHDNRPSYTMPFNNKRPAGLGGSPAQAHKYAGQPGNRQAIYAAEHEKENRRSDELQRDGGSTSPRSMAIRAVTPTATRIPKPNRTMSADVHDPVRDHYPRRAQILASGPPEAATITRSNTISDAPLVRNITQRLDVPIDEEEPRQYAPEPHSNFPPMDFRIPTDEENNQLARQLELQRELAKIPKRKGHTYGNIEASGRARVVRGDVYDAKNPEVTAIFSSEHIYGEGKFSEDSVIADVDMSSDDFHKFTNGADIDQLGIKPPI